MITEERIINTKDSKKKVELSQELKKQKGIPHYFKIKKELISGLN